MLSDLGANLRLILIAHRQMQQQVAQVMHAQFRELRSQSGGQIRLLILFGYHASGFSGHARKFIGCPQKPLALGEQLTPFPSPSGRGLGCTGSARCAAFFEIRNSLTPSPSPAERGANAIATFL